jgi:2-phospho-L-lactate/phosphoenolpyruvate guanylyltransferase
VSIDALVPLKRLDYAKTRLASVLDPQTRMRVMRALLDHTLEQVKAAPSIRSVTLVSSAVEAASIAAQHGVAHFDDRGLPWNDALAAAIAEAVTSEAVAIVSADVPLLTTDDVERFVAALTERGAVIARATDAGTNGVAMQPAGAMPTTFGIKGSAARHAELAERSGLTPVIVDIPGLAHDLDTAEDLDEALRHAMSAEVRAVLAGARTQ